MEIPPSVFVSSYKRRIVDEYKSDMVKYAATADKSRIRECFESIPAQLAREYKKFSYSVVRPGGRGRDYAGSLQWIEDADIIRRCYNTEITRVASLEIIEECVLMEHS